MAMAWANSAHTCPLAMRSPVDAWDVAASIKSRPKAFRRLWAVVWRWVQRIGGLPGARGVRRPETGLQASNPAQRRSGGFGRWSGGEGNGSEGCRGHAASDAPRRGCKHQIPPKGVPAVSVTVLDFTSHSRTDDYQS